MKKLMLLTMVAFLSMATVNTAIAQDKEKEKKECCCKKCDDKCKEDCKNGKCSKAECKDCKDKKSCCKKEQKAWFNFPSIHSSKGSPEGGPLYLRFRIYDLRFPEVNLAVYHTHLSYSI